MWNVDLLKVNLDLIFRYVSLNNELRPMFLTPSEQFSKGNKFKKGEKYSNVSHNIHDLFVGILHECGQFDPERRCPD